MVLPRFVLVQSLLAFVCLSLPCVAETVLLDFSSPTCGPCQQMRPTVARLVTSGYRVREINIQAEPQVAARFGVTMVPTFIVVVDGRETSRVVGLTSFQQLRQMLTQQRPGSPQRQPQSQFPDTFAAPVATGVQSTFAASNDLSIPQAGRIVAIQDPALAAVEFPAAPSRPAPSSVGSPNTHKRLIEASVKISVQDASGVSAGTGTIVDARSGEALVLTCGHLFRSSAGKGPITITLFQAGTAGAEIRTTATGRLIDFDLDRDLALLSFQTEVSLTPISIAQRGTPFSSGENVTTVGCNLGANPTAIDSRITTIDRYQGHPNVEVAGAPVEGRSGGGLFNAAGQLIGVCFAADPEANEGLYASLPLILSKLDSLGLSMVYQPSAPAGQLAASPPAPPQASLSADPSFAVRGQEPTMVPPPIQPITLTPLPLASSQPAAIPLSSTEQATFEEIQRRSENSEVICIIRPKNADGKSEVISLSDASPQLVRRLTELSATKSSLRR